MVSSTPLPVAEDLARLTRYERFAFRLVRGLSRGSWKSLTIAYSCQVTARWVDLCTRNLIHIDGLDSLGRIGPDDRVLMVSNHRSFFDQFVLNVMLYKRGGVRNHFFFPVRADFFYDHPTGLVVNGLIGGFSMYPPVFRQAEKRGFNRFALDEAAALLSRPGVLVGMHPEGTRNKGPDPYSFLPAQPGVGELCYKARPLVLPAFILGLNNQLGRQVLSNFTRTGVPIIAVYGEPIDLSTYYQSSARLATYKRIADRLLEAIAALSRRERAIRAELERAGAPPLPTHSE